MNDDNGNDGRHIVMARSGFSGRQAPCRDDNGIKYFDTLVEAEEFARKSRESMGINYHYWAEQA